MENQQHILLVVTSFNERQINQIKHTVDVFRADGARVSLLFAIPQIPAYYYQIPTMELLREDLVLEAAECLRKIGDMLHIAKENQWVEMGNFKHIVTQTAHDLNVDFTIMVGEAKPEQQQPAKVKCDTAHPHLAQAA